MKLRDIFYDDYGIRNGWGVLLTISPILLVLTALTAPLLFSPEGVIVDGESRGTIINVQVEGWYWKTTSVYFLHGCTANVEKSSDRFEVRNDDPFLPQIKAAQRSGDCVIIGFEETGLRGCPWPWTPCERFTSFTTSGGPR